MRNMLRRICGVVLVPLFAAGLASCAGKPEVTARQPSVWRASVSNGDKPGVGFEIIEGGDGPSGSFFLSDPSQPPNFDTAFRIPMKLLKVSANEYHASVRASRGGTDELSIRFVNQPDAFTRTAVIQQLNQPSSPRDYTFVRQRPRDRP